MQESAPSQDYSSGYESTSPSLYTYKGGAETLGKRNAPRSSGSKYPGHNHQMHAYANRNGEPARKNVSRGGTSDSSSSSSSSAPSLTADSGGSGQDRSESSAGEQELPKIKEVPDPRVLESAIFSINLQSPESGRELRVLPSLRKDAVIRAQFGEQSSRDRNEDSWAAAELPHQRYNYPMVMKLRSDSSPSDPSDSSDRAQESYDNSPQMSDETTDNNTGQHNQHNGHKLNLSGKNSHRHSSGEPSGPNGPEGPQGPSGSHIYNNTQLQAAERNWTPVDQVSSSSSERPFKCTYKNCDWSFVRSSDQKRHIRSHKKPLLQCPYWELDPACHRNGGAFNRLDVLKRHLRLMHFETKSGEVGNCKACKKEFCTVKAFIDHSKACAAELISQGRS